MLFLENEKLKVFLDILLELKEAGNTFTDDDLRDEVVTMMVGVSIFRVNDFNEMIRRLISDHYKLKVHYSFY